MTSELTETPLPAGWVETSGGPTIRNQPAAHICHPVAPDRHRSTLVFVPGGGWRGENTENGRWLARLAVRRGYVAGALSYRLSSEAAWPAAVEDVAAGLAWVQAHGEEFGVDTTRFVLVGISAGGQLAASIAYHQPGFPALILIAAVTDLADARLAPGLQQSARTYLGNADPAAASPIGMVVAGAPPTLVLTGGADRIVPAAVSDAFVATLAAHDVPYEHVVFANARHSFQLDDPHAVIDTIDAFLRRQGVADGRP